MRNAPSLVHEYGVEKQLGRADAGGFAPEVNLAPESATIAQLLGAERIGIGFGAIRRKQAGVGVQVAAEQEAEKVRVADERNPGVGRVLNLSPQVVDAPDERSLRLLVADPPPFAHLGWDGQARVGRGWYGLGARATCNGEGQESSRARC